MVCRDGLRDPFTMFLINGDYSYKVTSNGRVFSKVSEKQCRIDHNGNMNPAAQKRFLVFLKMWLKLGVRFIHSLRLQFLLTRGVA